MPNLSEQIKLALMSEGEYLETSIRQSISDNRQEATGFTQRTLNHRINGETLEVWGMSNIFSLERGVKPEEANMLKTGYFAAKLLEWSKYKPILFANEKERRTFAWLTAKKIQSQGSKLFKANRRDVYTDKAEISAQRLSDKIVDVIVNYKILD